ncbi:MAG: hypothetical protein WCB67_07185 [Solirubrobacteraceae bacterium]
MSAARVIGVLALAILEGSLVALPRPDALARFSRLRSPAWAAILPGSILVGTFAPLWHPSLAFALVLLATLATPLLAILAAVGVARGRRALLLIAALALLAGAAIDHGLVGRLSSTIVTALGCLCVGVALTRLIPRRWLLMGVTLMCLVDVLLLAAGLGQPAAALMAHAAARVHGLPFGSASVGSVRVDYPDLVLAAVLGGFVAGHAWQRGAALTLTALAAAFGMLLAVVDPIPATVPITLTFVLLTSWARIRPRVAASRRETFPAGPGSRWTPATQTKAAESGIFPGAMCDHLSDTVTRYDRERRLLTCLLVCPECRTEMVVETFAYEPNFSSSPRPGVPDLSNLAKTTLGEQRERRAVREEGLRLAA